MKVLIIEDEKPSADKLIRHLKALDSRIGVLDVLDTIDKAVRWLQQYQAELIFLDIHLADGVSFKIFEHLQQQGITHMQTPIIFTTAYDEYAIQAFKLNSIDYLLKPVSKRELQTSLEKYKQLKSQQQAPEQNLKALMLSLQKPTYRKRFMVSYGQTIKSIEVAEIAYFYAHEKLVQMLSFQNQKYIVDYTMQQLEDTLDPEQFFRINRKFIVNIDAIAQMYTYSKSRVKLDLKPQNQMEAVVSVERSPDFKAWLNR